MIESEWFPRSSDTNNPASRGYVPGLPFWGYPARWKADGAPSRGDGAFLAGILFSEPTSDTMRAPVWMRCFEALSEKVGVCVARNLEIG